MKNKLLFIVCLLMFAFSANAQLSNKTVIDSIYVSQEGNDYYGFKFILICEKENKNRLLNYIDKSFKESIGLETIKQTINQDTTQYFIYTALLVIEDYRLPKKNMTKEEIDSYMRASVTLLNYRMQRARVADKVREQLNGKEYLYEGYY